MSILASEIMTSPVLSVAPTASLAEIASLLAEKHISAVPVCDANGMLLGIVSEGDILRPYRESSRSKREQWLGMLAAGESLSEAFLDYLRIDTRSAADVMVRHVIAAEENMTLPQLAELIVRHGVKRLPVLRDGRVVGIVSRADMVAALAKSPAMTL